MIKVQFPMTRYTSRLRATAFTLAIGLGTLCTASAQAASSVNLNNLYYGVKVGAMSVDAVGYGDAVNIGGIVGLPITRLAQGKISVEGEFTTSLIKGDLGLFGTNGDWRITTLAGYGVFRTDGPMYFKAKAGLLYENVSVSIAGVPGSVSGSDTGLSYGIGGGMTLSGGQSIEIEYTVIESNVNFLSIGYNF
jgi:outer membrane immunogenic protein